MLRRLWERQRHNPTMIGLLLNPFYHARRGLYAGISDAASEITGCILDLGCGRKPYKELFSATSYVGIDVYSPTTIALSAADVLFDGKNIPISDASVDAIVCSQVIEHVFAPMQFIEEMHRVLRPGGKVLITVPFAWDEHEQPWDYARYTTFGLRSLLEQGGFAILRQEKIGSDARALFQLLNGYIYKVTMKRRSRLRTIAMALLTASVNVIAALFYRWMPKNPDFYLDQLVIAQKSG